VRRRVAAKEIAVAPRQLRHVQRLLELKAQRDLAQQIEEQQIEDQRLSA
jgi:hypothetical protein